MLERYYRELLNFCTRAASNRDVAADVVQETYARALAAQQAGEPIAAPRAFLHQTARNLLIDQHRRAQVREHEDIDSLTEAEHPASPSHMQPDAMYSSEQRAAAIIAAIDGLPARCREAFLLNRFDGLSHEEVAARMGISKNMVAQHVTRAVLVCKACVDQLDGEAAAVSGQRNGGLGP